MDSPLTGYRNAPIELIRIETNWFDLYIKGKPFHPTVEMMQLHRQEDVWVDAHFHIETPSPKVEMTSVEVFSHQTMDLQTWHPGDPAAPLFFETQPYEFVLEKKQGDLPIVFFHENLHLRQAVKPIGSRSRILS